MAKLLVISGADRKEFRLDAHNTLGRHPTNTIQILDRIISKEHIRITRDRGQAYTLYDLDSLNGTFIDGQRVSQHTLSDGNEITIGSTTMVFSEDATDDDFPLQRVTIARTPSPDLIHQRISTQIAHEFPAEHLIDDTQALRRDYERLRIAHELSHSVGNELDLDRLLHRILDKAFEMLSADRGVILLLNREGEPVPRVAKERGGLTRGSEISISRSILKEVMDSRQAVLSSDATVDSRFSAAHSIIMQGIRSTMCVPLLHGEDLLGIMHLDSQIATGAFEQKDLQIFSTIGAHAAVAIRNASLVAKIKWEAKTRAQLQRFFSPDVMQEIVDGKLKLDSVGEMREVTALFADIRGFTAMTENADARDIVAMLNEYFEVMVEVLFDSNGTLDKYVGDEIMALFGVPVARESAALDAVTCAQRMMIALAEFNETRMAEKQEPIEIGIGINTGTCIYGTIGSSRALQPTAIGDTINTASRLCSIARGGEIVISEATYRHVANHIEAQTLPSVTVKGKNDAIEIYRVGWSRQ